MEESQVFWDLKGKTSHHVAQTEEGQDWGNQETHVTEESRIFFYYYFYPHVKKSCGGHAQRFNLVKQNNTVIFASGHGCSSSPRITWTKENVSMVSINSPGSKMSIKLLKLGGKEGAMEAFYKLSQANILSGDCTARHGHLHPLRLVCCHTALHYTTPRRTNCMPVSASAVFFNARCTVCRQPPCSRSFATINRHHHKHRCSARTRRIPFSSETLALTKVARQNEGRPERVRERERGVGGKKGER